MLVRAVVAFALVGLTGCDVVAQGRAVLTNPADRVVAAPVDSARANREANDPQGVLIAIAPATEPGVFATLSEPTRAEVLRLYGWALSRTRRYDAAEEVYRQLANNRDATSDDRFWRLHNASWNEDPVETGAALPPVLRQDDAGGLTDPFDVQMVDFALGGLPDPRPARRRLGDTLEEISWPVRTDVLDDGGALVDRQIVWLHYAQALVDTDAARAAAIAKRVTRPDLLVALQADRRFDGIIAADPSRFDPVAAAQRAVSEADTASRAEPARLALRLALAKAQAATGDYLAAEHTLDDAVSTARSGGPTGAMFHDACPCYVDALLWRVSFMSANGRGEAALATLGDITATQDIDPNDMRLRQARMLLMLNRPAEAGKRLADVDDALLSGYSRMERAALKACIATAQGDRGAAAPALTYLEAHRNVDVSFFLDGEICAGNPDHTAAMLIELLKQPAHSASALYELQGVPAWPHDNAYRVRENQGRAALAARPDVAAAVNAVGHVKRYDLQRMTNSI